MSARIAAQEILEFSHTVVREHNKKSLVKMQGRDTAACAVMLWAYHFGMKGYSSGKGESWARALRELYEDYDSFHKVAEHLNLPVKGRERMTLTCRTVALILLDALNMRGNITVRSMVAYFAPKPLMVFNDTLRHEAKKYRFRNWRGVAHTPFEARVHDLQDRSKEVDLDQDAQFVGNYTLLRILRLQRIRPDAFHLVRGVPLAGMAQFQYVRNYSPSPFRAGGGFLGNLVRAVFKGSKRTFTWLTRKKQDGQESAEERPAEEEREGAIALAWGNCLWLQQVYGCHTIMLFEKGNLELEQEAWSKAQAWCEKHYSTVFSQNDLLTNEVVDWTMPTAHNLVKFAQLVYGTKAKGQRVAGHCTAGMGRTGFMVVFILMISLRIPNPLACLAKLQTHYRPKSYHEVVEVILSDSSFEDHWREFIPRMVNAYVMVYNHSPPIPALPSLDISQFKKTWDDQGLTFLRTMRTSRLRVQINFDKLQKMYTQFAENHHSLDDLAESLSKLSLGTSNAQGRTKQRSRVHIHIRIGETTYGLHVSTLRELLQDLHHNHGIKFGSWHKGGSPAKMWLADELGNVVKTQSQFARVLKTTTHPTFFIHQQKKKKKQNNSHFIMGWLADLVS